MENDEAEFREDLAAARQDFENGRVSEAVDRLLSARWTWRYAKAPERFKLLQEMYAQVELPLSEEICRRNPHLVKLLFELYSIWPKLHLEAAILKHSFPESGTDAYIVTGARSVQLAENSAAVWIGPGPPVALSRGRHSLKFWDVETGEVIHAREEALELIASFIGRDSSHLLFAQPFTYANELNWSVSFRETLRRISILRGGTYEKSHYENVTYYKVIGEVVAYRRERTLEVDRKAFEENPIKGQVLPPRKFEKETPQSMEYLRYSYSEVEVQELLAKVEQEKEAEKHIVRIRQFETLTLAHEEIEGYLPAGTTDFFARSSEFDGAKVDDIAYGDRITAKLAVEGDDAWLENIIVPGHGLRGMYGVVPTTPITALCLSSDGSLAMRNGNGAIFGLWHMWTGDHLRKFVGHTDRVTCLCLSVDVSFAVSGSEDKTVRVWTPVSAECVRVLKGHDAAITKVCISLDASKILSADNDGVIKLWDRGTGECLRTIHAHTQSVSGLQLSFDGRFAVSGSWDKTVKLWNLDNGSCMKTLEFSDWVTAVDMTPDGRYLVASSYEGTKVWELLWRIEPRDVTEWDEGAQPYVEILMNANAAWEGKLSTPVDMTEEEKRNSLRRQSPSWTAWHAPSEKNDWHRVWHLDWNIETTLGYVGYGWLTGSGEQGSKFMDDWKRRNDPQADEPQP